MDIISSILSAVSSPAMAAVAATRCTLNGHPIDCADFPGMSGGPIWSLIFGGMILWLAIAALFIVSNWKIYTKAGKPGWTSIVPIYNIVVLLEIVGEPLWWVILWLIPVVNMVIAIIAFYRLSLSFGKGIGFTIGIFLLPFIFMPILAFGKAEYRRLPDSVTAPKAV